MHKKALAIAKKLFLTLFKNSTSLYGNCQNAKNPVSSTLASWIAMPIDLG